MPAFVDANILVHAEDGAFQVDVFIETFQPVYDNLHKFTGTAERLLEGKDLTAAMPFLTPPTVGGRLCLWSGHVTRMVGATSETFRRPRGLRWAS